MRQHAEEVRITGLFDASTSIETSAQDAPNRHDILPREILDPIYILAAVTLGIPILLLIPLVGLNPGLQEGMLPTITMSLIVTIFLVAMVFEIKRLADLPSDTEHH